jgi:hypothetical protein
MESHSQAVRDVSSSPNMTNLFNSNRKRSAISAITMVVAVLAIGAIAKSEAAASHLAQIIRISDNDSAILR